MRHVEKICSQKSSKDQENKFFNAHKNFLHIREDLFKIYSQL